MSSALEQEAVFTVSYIENLPDGVRAELLDGIVYDMAPPNTRHQLLLSELHAAIHHQIKSKKGKCKVFPAPFAVYLHDDELNYVEPDISVICDPSKINEKGCNGAPDWIIEIVSPSSVRHDYVTKLSAYMNAGVKEYWIVNLLKNMISVTSFDDLPMQNYTFNEKIKVHIYDDFEIDFAELDIDF
jgi:Uma2 family endonuclease